MAIKVLIYARVSSKEQAQKDSLKGQMRDCTKMAKNMGYNDTEIKTFEDVFTGSATSRPGLDKLRDFLESHSAVDFVLIREIDRISRGGFDEYGAIKKFIRSHKAQLLDYIGTISGKRLNLVEELAGEHPGLKGFDGGYDWQEINPSEDAEEAAASSARKERFKIAQRTHPKSIQYLWDGWLIRQAEYGYKNATNYDSGEKRKIREIYEPEAKFIRQMFSMTTQGFSTDTICERLNEKGYRSRIRNSKNGKIGGIKLRPKELGQYLRNPVYAGFNYEKRTNGFCVPAKHEPIVPLESWNRANLKLGTKPLQLVPSTEQEELYEIKRLSDGKRQYKKFDRHFPFKMLLKSPYEDVMLTGSASTSATGKRNNAYYHTTMKAKKSYRAKRDDVHEWMANVLNSIEFHSNVVKEFKQQIVNGFQELQSSHVQRMETKEKAIQELRVKESELYEKFKKVSSERVFKMIESDMEGIANKIEELENSRTEERMSKEDFKQILERALKIIEHLPELMEYANTRELLGCFMRLIFKHPPSPEDLNISKNRTLRLTPLMRVKKVSTDDKSVWQAPA